MECVLNVLALAVTAQIFMQSYFQVNETGRLNLNLDRDFLNANVIQAW